MMTTIYPLALTNAAMEEEVGQQSGNEHESNAECEEGEKTTMNWTFHSRVLVLVQHKKQGKIIESKGIGFVFCTICNTFEIIHVGHLNYSFNRTITKASYYYPNSN